MSLHPGVRHDRLRQATRIAHRAVEAALARTASFSSRDGYRRYLTALAPVHAGLESALTIAGTARLLPDWPARRRMPLIRRELHGLGDDALGDPPPLIPPPRHDGDILGTLYVLEGATLGGAVLAGRLRQAGVAVEPGASLLDPYGEGRGAMWRGFLATLEAARLSMAEEAALSQRAVATFALFHECIASLPRAAAPDLAR